MLEQIISTFLVVSIVTFIFGRVMRNAKTGKAARDGFYKVISIPNGMYGFIAVSGFLFCCVGLGVIWFVRDQAGAGYAFIGFGLFCLAYVFIVKAFCVSEIRWNHQKISGPNGQSPLKLSEYNWVEARHIGYAKNGHLYLTFADKNKIFVLTWKTGWTELIDDIQIYAPHVEIDPKVMEAIAPKS